MNDYTIHIGPIIKGDYKLVQTFLEKETPSDAQLFFLEEPYCTIQSKVSLRVFRMIINDKRFVFDDLFIARQLYFSTSGLRDLILKHPRCLKVLRAKKYFTDYFYERYGKNAHNTHVGMLQRYLQVENALRFWAKKNRIRIAFFLYPALIKHIRRFRERYYAPEGNGFLKAKIDFQQLVCA